MDVTINKDLLVREFGLARRLGERKATLPVYGYARVEADFDKVHVSATDGEAALELTCPAMEVGEPGTLLVPIRAIHELARASAVDGVRISKDGDRVMVQAGKFKSRLGTLPLSDFMNIAPAPPSTTEFTTETLSKMLEKVRFVVEASAGKSGNPAFHGALLKIEGKALSFVATDGYRMSVVEMKLEKAEDSQVLVPRKALDDLSALLAIGDAPEKVGYVAKDGKAYFTVGQRTFITRLLDAQFPAYQRVLPKLAAPSTDVDRDALLGLVRRVMLISPDATKKTDFEVAEKSVTATLVAATSGDATEGMDAATTGDGWATAFDARYLADFLAAAEAGTVRWCQQSAKHGARFQSIEGPIEYTYALMPMSR